MESAELESLGYSNGFTSNDTGDSPFPSTSSNTDEFQQVTARFCFTRSFVFSGEQWTFLMMAVIFFNSNKSPVPELLPKLVH